MVTLSAKARLFLEAALAHPRTAWISDEARSLGADPWTRPLSPQATEIALNALGEMEKYIRDRLGDLGLDIDEEADLINDLGFVDAVRSDLLGSLRAA